MSKLKSGGSIGSAILKTITSWLKWTRHTSATLQICMASKADSRDTKRRLTWYWDTGLLQKWKSRTQSNLLDIKKVPGTVSNCHITLWAHPRKVHSDSFGHGFDARALLDWKIWQLPSSHVRKPKCYPSRHEYWLQTFTSQNLLSTMQGYLQPQEKICRCWWSFLWPQLPLLALDDLSWLGSSLQKRTVRSKHVWL